MTITVYAHLADEAKKRLDKIAKKADRYSIPFSYTVGEEHPQTVNVYSFDDVNHNYYVSDSYVVAAVDFEIECGQLIRASGWTTKAMIEHGEEGNIVTAFGNFEVPAAWYKIPARCDHCKTNRARNVTFMVEHENGDIKQVGKSCLKDYTGIFPEAAIMFAEIGALDCTGRDFDPDYEGASGVKMFDVEEIIALACDEIKKNGFRKSDMVGATRDVVEADIRTHKPTSGESLEKAKKIINWMLTLAKTDADRQNEINDLYRKAFGDPDPNDPWGYHEPIDDEAHEEYLKKSREYARAWDSVSDLERNCFPLIKSGYAKVKHFGRLCYLPVDYDKYLERKAKAEERESIASASDYIGKIGERITVTVKEANVVTSWETMYGTTWLNKIVDVNGNILIWKSSSCAEIKPGNILKGTVKEHSEYDGAKQTVVTRCKIS